MTVLMTHAEIEELGGGRVRQEIAIKRIADYRNGNLYRLLNQITNTGDPSLLLLKCRISRIANCAMRHAKHSAQLGSITPFWVIKGADFLTEFWCQFCLNTAPAIFQVGHQLKMARVYARSITAEMVGFVAFRDRAESTLIIVSVCKPLPDSSISTGILGSLPHPTTSYLIYSVARLAASACKIVPWAKGVAFALDVTPSTIGIHAYGCNLPTATKAVTRRNRFSHYVNSCRLVPPHEAYRLPLDVSSFLARLGCQSRLLSTTAKANAGGIRARTMFAPPVPINKAHWLSLNPAILFRSVRSKRSSSAAAAMTVSIRDRWGRVTSGIIAHGKASLAGFAHAVGRSSAATAFCCSDCITIAQRGQAWAS